jgi:hypothetical protein
MHTTIMPLTIQGQATQPAPARWRAWVKALRPLASKRFGAHLNLKTAVSRCREHDF